MAFKTPMSKRLLKRRLVSSAFADLLPPVFAAWQNMERPGAYYEALLRILSTAALDQFDQADLERLFEIQEKIAHATDKLSAIDRKLTAYLQGATPVPYSIKVPPLLEPYPEDNADLEDVEDEHRPIANIVKNTLSIAVGETLPEVKEPEPITLLPLFEDQQEALDDILQWATDKSEDEPFYVLRGYAGTGKSTLMTHVVQALGERVVPTALTNAAARILSEMLTKAGLKINKASTIYSVLKLVMKQEEDKLVLTKVDSPDSPVVAGTVFLVDECSMIPKAVLREIKRYAAKHNVKFLFVGDPFQINPVGELRSPVWKLEAPNWQLTKIRRFDSSLLRLSIEIRRRIKEKEYHIDDLFIPSDEIEIIKPSKFLTAVQDAFVETNGEDNSIRVLAWTNRRVDEYSAAIRKALGRKERFEPGDSLMMAAPVHETIPGAKYGTSNKKIVSYIDDEVKVIGVTGAEVSVWMGNKEIDVPTHKLAVTGDYSGNLFVPKDQKKFDTALSDLADEARIATGHARAKLWKSFWDAKETFHSVRYSQSITVHRAQGSTYRNVFLDAGNIAANPEGREMIKCMYVGASRPSSLLYVRV